MCTNLCTRKLPTSALLYITVTVAMMWWRKVNLKAPLESRLPCFSSGADCRQVAAVSTRVLIVCQTASPYHDVVLAPGEYHAVAAQIEFDSKV